MRKRNNDGYFWLFFIGFLMLGYAVGFITGNLPAGMYGGMGVGFIVTASLYLKYRKK